MKVRDLQLRKKMSINGLLTYTWTASEDFLHAQFYFFTSHNHNGFQLSGFLLAFSLPSIAGVSTCNQRIRRPTGSGNKGESLARSRLDLQFPRFLRYLQNVGGGDGYKIQY